MIKDELRDDSIESRGHVMVHLLESILAWGLDDVTSSRNTDPFERDTLKNKDSCFSFRIYISNGHDLRLLASLDNDHKDKLTVFYVNFTASWLECDEINPVP